ncbi:hypothetical protein [Phytohabitans houttuyneae]
MREMFRTGVDIERLPARRKGGRTLFGRHRLDWKWTVGLESDEGGAA